MTTELDVYRYYGKPAESNPPPRGLVIFGLSAAAALAIYGISRLASAAGAPSTVAPTPGPGPGPGPLPPPVGPGPTPGPTQPKDAGPKPGWADDNPYGFNAQPGDPYVSPTGLWIAADCSRWKMGSQWLEEIAVPIIQQWIDAGWTAGAAGNDVYTKIGASWAWGWEVGRSIIKPYLEQSNPQGPLCTEGFIWPWETRDYWKVSTEFDIQTNQFVCPQGYDDKPFGGSLCVQPSIFDQFETTFNQFQADYPALFTDETGLYALIWNVWLSLSAGQPWDQIVETALNSLKMANA